ncbi:hypothetical protein HHI36_008925 [Cryptolaemus montrouzieri]|uniref:Uncharacterized protein n=1 Tax=Cryptolaemus montrouzieri TaxID=559131 RepID=A0ABD2MTT0_9CUCU
MSRNKRLTERQLIEYAERCFDIEEEDEEPFMESMSNLRCDHQNLRVTNFRDRQQVRREKGIKSRVPKIRKEQLLSSKLYFNLRLKPEGANKIFHMEEVLSCLKQTFVQSRSESTFQSIDETMVQEEKLPQAIASSETHKNMYEAMG